MTGEELAPVSCASTRSDANFYGTAVPPTARLETALTLLGRSGDVSVNLGGDGAGNQRFPDAGRLVRGGDFLDPCLATDNAEFVATASSARASTITTYRRDFGDGSPIVETTERRVRHDYGRHARGRFRARVEA